MTTTAGAYFYGFNGARPASTTQGPTGWSEVDGFSAAGTRAGAPGRRGFSSTTTTRPGNRMLPVVMEFLGQAGLPDVWTVDHTRRTVLHLAAIEGRDDVTHALLGSSVFTAIDAQDSQGNVALHLAAHHGHAEIAMQILRCGRFTKAGEKNSAEKTALHMAASSPFLDATAEVALLLLRELPALAADELDNRGRTALHLAALHGNIALVRALLASERFTATRVQDSKGMTALHLAATKGHVNVVRALLEPRFGPRPKDPIDAEAKDHKGRTALDLANAQDKADVANAILEGLPAVALGPSVPTVRLDGLGPHLRPTQRSAVPPSASRGPRPGKWKATIPNSVTMAAPSSRAQ